MPLQVRHKQMLMGFLSKDALQLALRPVCRVRVQQGMLQLLLCLGCGQL